MVNLTRIYTRTGDDGTTALGDFSRTAKTDVRLAAYADANEAKVEAGVDQAGDFVDSKTGGQYAGQVDQAQEFLKDQVGAPNEAPAEPTDPGAA